MRDYHDYIKIGIGGSDIASVIMVGCGEEGLITKPLHFGMDGGYTAYYVDEEAEIGEHYTLVEEFESWLKIYDDDGLVFRADAEKIKVFRAGEMGCIIQTFGRE